MPRSGCGGGRRRRGAVDPREQSVRDVTDQLKIYRRKDAEADLLQLLRHRLRDESKGKWLVLVNNADNVGFLLERPATLGAAQPPQRRIDYVPATDAAMLGAAVSRGDGAEPRITDESPAAGRTTSKP
ncbi:hypothetical protein LTS10_013122 [Elasticomyces elasticus]|nr:hypothetical protein LTS10_013122 [Elasticomyces elasticus]